ncbi:MAG: TIGR02147 family protein [Oligoflexia bacterium]|nr:TIGR02147 family protein [Oligoflexia bacterium]
MKISELTTAQSYRDVLSQEFSRRKKRNPAYTLRAFSRDLGIAPPKLSEALRKKGGFSVKTAKQIAERLKLSPEESELFAALVEMEHGRSTEARVEACARASRLRAKASFPTLELELFRVIRDWYHFALLELTELKSFRSDPQWIARKLGIDSVRARRAVARLIQAKLLRKEPNGRLVQTDAFLAVPGGVSSNDVKAHHLQVLEKAGNALGSLPLGEREFSTVTMAFDSSRMEEARRELIEFKRKFCKDIQAGESKKDRVYCLAIQFFPVDQK